MMPAIVHRIHNIMDSSNLAENKNGLRWPGLKVLLNTFLIYIANDFNLTVWIRCVQCTVYIIIHETEYLQKKKNAAEEWSISYFYFYLLKVVSLSFHSFFYYFTAILERIEKHIS